MSAAALLEETPEPTDADIDEAMNGNLCRCTTYLRIRRAIHHAASLQRTAVPVGGPGEARDDPPAHSAEEAS
jgi:xanthine dehydrogenase iron-sulfur cluster and FAD-binding subunit A